MPRPSPRRFLLAFAIVGAASTARADSWSPPKPITQTSPSGAWIVDLTPDGGFGGNSASLKVRTKRGKVVYERKVINPRSPVEVAITDSGHVVTMDNWHNAGYHNALVIYAPDGALFVDKSLEEILTTVQLRAVDESVSSRWWREGDITHTKRGIAVATKFGTLSWDVATGAQYLEGRPMYVPTDRQRLAEYLSGKRKYKTLRLGFEQDGRSCAIEREVAECDPLDDTLESVADDGPRRPTKQVDPNLFRQAVAAMRALVPVIHSGFRPGYRISISVEEAGYTYHFSTFVDPATAPPEQLAAALAVKRLTPL